jgi:hypothetical protein
MKDEVEGMSGYYNKELYDLYMEEEQKSEAKKQKEQAGEQKKLSSAVDKAIGNAKLAFEQTQENRFEIDMLRKSLKRVTVIAVIAVVIALISLAVALNGQMPTIMG